MNKFTFIAAFFLLGAGLMPLLGLWNILHFFRLRRSGVVEKRPARVSIIPGRQGARQVSLVVELADAFGEVIELRSRTTCKDWVVYDGEEITVVYDPQRPLGGWIEHDLRNRLKLVGFLTPLFFAIGGALVLIGAWA